MKMFAKIKENRRKRREMYLALKELFDAANPPKQPKEATLKIVYKKAS